MIWLMRRNITDGSRLHQELHRLNFTWNASIYVIGGHFWGVIYLHVVTNKDSGAYSESYTHSVLVLYIYILC